MGLQTDLRRAEDEQTLLREMKAEESDSST